VVNLHVFKTRVTKSAMDKVRLQMGALEKRMNIVDALVMRVSKLERKGAVGDRMQRQKETTPPDNDRVL